MRLPVRKHRSPIPSTTDFDEFVAKSDLRSGAGTIARIITPDLDTVPAILMNAHESNAHCLLHI